MMRQDNGHELKYKKFPIDIERNLFSLRVVRDCNILPRGVVESPSLELLKT